MNSRKKEKAYFCSGAADKTMGTRAKCLQRGIALSQSPRYKKRAALRVVLRLMVQLANEETVGPQ